MQATIKAFLQEHCIPENAGFIIAVSGGADSITLLHAFKYMNLKILALHCNFNLRDKESDMDEQFVKRFCDTYGISLSVKKFQTTEYATEKGISIEMAARELRYEWFEEMRLKKKMDYIVVGHHADDVAETVFINLCRGTGIKGLTGIKPVNGEILRPLLCKSKEEILQYIEANQLGFRTDSTNNSLDYLRNKVRHLIIPVFKEINPAFLDTIAENCKALQETEQIYRYGIANLQKYILEQEGDEILIHIGKTLSSPAPYTFLYETLKPIGFNKTQVCDILNTNDAIPGKQFFAGDFILTKGRIYWRLFENKQKAPTDLQINGEGIYSINNRNYRFTLLAVPENFTVPKDSSVAFLDADKVKFPLTVRNWEKGDSFCPIGMKKSKKKLSDFFADQKFSAKQKRDCLLLLSGGEIAWVIGQRIDDRFKLTSLTRTLLCIEPTE